ncbi:AAA family ATPase [Pseudomonas sp. NA-150]|uniref:trifunctional serine/threonine-protein kinase/ATP-binding protein/sensor histidine kinase n=1 Tax=Pseudomonas sp. NA-150 TaxID=3367525 RepID=UPI0037C8B7B8
MKPSNPPPSLCEPATLRTETAVFSDQWLQQLDWHLLLVDGEVARYRVSSSESAQQWMILRPAAQGSDNVFRRINHEFELRDLLDPSWAVMPVALLPSPEGPLLVLDDNGGRLLQDFVSEKLSISRFLRLAIGAAQALDRAHARGILHRDIKPMNLIEGSDRVVRLTAFALSVHHSRNLSGVPDSISGSLAYMSPEQAGRAGSHTDERSDLYSLGISFYEMLTGRLPFKGNDPVEWLHQHVALQPVPPEQWRNSIPAPLGRLVLKLLAKNPADRYQCANALEADLRFCLANWSEFRHIRDFEPGGSSNRNADPLTSRLIARADERVLLLDCVERVGRSGQSEIVLLSGCAGVGKTALVRQLHQELAGNRILFATGTFDQYQRTMPYASLTRALRSLVLRILGEDPLELQRWRASLLNVLGADGRLIANLVPEIELVTGPFALSAEMPSHDAQERFNALLLRLVQSFATAQCPLILFFDDLQWLDNDTLAFLSALGQGAFQHLVLIGAYRDQQTDSSPAFEAFLQSMHVSQQRVTRLALQPLRVAEVAQIVSATLGLEVDALGSLSQILHDKTDGNPFFVHQLLQTLLDERLIDQVRDLQGWSWDPARIAAFPVAENVIELMVARISRLPVNTRDLLGLLALSGSRADEADLACFSGLSANSVRHHLIPAIEAKLLLEEQGGLLFSHDRVREAAYSLIPQSRRPAEHARMARRLIDQMSPDDLQGALFRVALHIQQSCSKQLVAQDRALFIEVLLQAAHKAKDTAAVSFALQYLQLAQRLGGEGRWQQNYPQNYDIDFLQAQCLIYNAQYAEADATIEQLLERVFSLTEVSSLYVLKVELLSLSGDYEAAVQAALSGLALFGIDVRGANEADSVQSAYARLRDKLGTRSIESLVELGPLKNLFIKAAIELLASMIDAASLVDEDLLFLLLCRIVQLTLRHGVTEASPVGLAWFGVVVAQRFDAYEDGLRYADVAREIVARHAYLKSEASTLMALDQLSVWIRPLEFSLGCAEKALKASRSEGNPSMACHANNQIISNLLIMGAPLARIEQQIDVGLTLCRQHNFRFSQVTLDAASDFVRTIRDSSEDRGETTAGQPAAHLLETTMVPAKFRGWLFSGIQCFIFHDLPGAQDSLRKARECAWSLPAHILQLELELFSALTVTALCDPATDVQASLASLQPSVDKLRRWATLNPATFRDKLLLVEAEIARIEGRTLAAMALYDSAIRQATVGGFIQVQALSHELAGRCYEAHGLTTAARSHFRSARDSFYRWGATRKVRDLELRHLYLHDQPATSRSSVNLIEGQHYLDMISVTKASQALSREIVFDRLIELLVTNTIVHAGARRGVLVLLRDGAPMIVASGQVEDTGVEVRLSSIAADSTHLPLSMLYTVLRTRQSIALDQADADEMFAADGFFQTHSASSVLCLPLLKQGEVIGALYLENALASGVFTHGRIGVIELLAAQAAISLETSRLYAELLEENARRRDTEAALRTSQAFLAMGQQISQSGTFRWNPFFDETLWSNELFAIWGLALAESPPKRSELIQWVHPDDRPRYKAVLDRAVRTHAAFRHEFRVITADGTVKHLETLAEPTGDRSFVGVISDLTDRKNTEMALRNARTELAHVSQATILGELAASIAHEINQPLVSIVSNASASVRWLKREVPEVQEALEGLLDIAKDGQRAADIVYALQALAKQKASHYRKIVIDDVIRQVLMLTASEIEQKQVAVVAELDASSVRVHSDSVQLQQVILNLMMNAVDAMVEMGEGNRRLTVTSSVHSDERVVVTIEDTGPGVSPANEDNIFNAFFTTKASGMGMGLAICRSIMNAQGGTLHMLPGRQGGTIFVFTLPGVERVV